MNNGSNNNDVGRLTVVYRISFCAQDVRLVSTFSSLFYYYPLLSYQTDLASGSRSMVVFYTSTAQTHH